MLLIWHNILIGKTLSFILQIYPLCILQILGQVSSSCLTFYLIDVYTGHYITSLAHFFTRIMSIMVYYTSNTLQIYSNFLILQIFRRIFSIKIKKIGINCLRFSIFV